jgi:hypothetical protein
MESMEGAHEAKHAAGAFAEAIDRLTQQGSITHQKAALTRQIRDAVNDSETDASIYGRVADIVILSDAEGDGSAYGRLIGILKKLERIRESHRLGKGEGFRTSPGAFFLNQVRQWPEWVERGETLADKFGRRKPR